MCCTGCTCCCRLHMGGLCVLLFLVVCLFVCFLRFCFTSLWCKNHASIRPIGCVLADSFWLQQQRLCFVHCTHVCDALGRGNSVPKSSPAVICSFLVSSAIRMRSPRLCMIFSNIYIYERVVILRGISHRGFRRSRPAAACGRVIGNRCVAAVD